MDPSFNDSPFPPETALPPGWIQQFDSNYNVPYYVNTATNESSWTHPFERDEYKNIDYQDPSVGGGPATGTGTRGMNDFGGQDGGYGSGYGGGGGGGYGASPAPSGGQASSFYNSGPQGPGYSAQGPIPDDGDGQVGPNGERGIGKVVAGGMALYMAKKMFDKWQSGKKHSQQPYYSGGPGQNMQSFSSFKPTSFFGGNGKYSHGGFGGGHQGYGPPGYGPPGYFGGSRDVQSGYGGSPAPSPYGGQPDFDSNSNSFQSQPGPGYSSPFPPQGDYNGNSYQSPQPHSGYGGPPPPSGGSGWGDPRF